MTGHRLLYFVLGMEWSVYMNNQFCTCYEQPEQGKFLVGKQYMWDYVIDGIIVKDEDDVKILFDEIKWLWYFVTV